MFLWNLLAFVVLSLAQLVVDSAWQLVAVRVLLGLAIGVEYAVGAALLAEFVPRRPRGALLGSIQAMWIVGFVAAFLIGSAVAPGAWRWLLASSAVPALAVLLLRTGLPESPRWLHARGRTAEAERIVRERIGDYALPDVAGGEGTRAGLAELFTAGRWRQSLYAGLFWFCQVAPFFATFTFVGPILALLDVQEGFTGDLLMNLLQLVGAGLGVWALHLLPRRAFVVSSFAVMVVGLLVIGLFPDAPGVLVVAAFGLFTLVISGASNIQFVYPSEMFETRLRTTGVGFAAAFSRIGAALATYLLPVSLDALGAHGTLLPAAAFPLVGLVASLAWAPETKRSALTRTRRTAVNPSTPLHETDVVVVGLGAFGSAALWRLAARGVRVTGVERFAVGHALGSSHGATRLFRVACCEHPALAPLVLRSLALRDELGERTGQVLVRQIGCLNTGAPASAPVAGTLAAAEAAGVPVTTLNAEEVRQSYPGYAWLDDDDLGVLDPWAGICYPERNVRAHVAEAVRLGAEVFEHTSVSALEATGDGVLVRTPTGTIGARQVVVATGAWLGKLVPQLPLDPRRMPMFFFRARPGREADYDLDAFPAFTRALPDGTEVWGHGSAEDHGIELGLLPAADTFAPTDADGLDRFVHASDSAELCAAVARAFPGVEPTPDSATPCMVDNTPDEQFLVGRPHGTERVVVAGGDSAHGFKHAAGVGELVAQLVVGEQPFLDTAFVDPRRFGTA